MMRRRVLIDNPFKTQYQEFIYTRTYARWLDKENRRENWPETVKRYSGFFRSRVPAHLLHDFDKAMAAVYKLEVMPSMRALWSAGEALEKENISGYNCAYTVIDSVKSFSEILYILMCGTGVGFSTERQYINQLPEVPKEILKDNSYLITVVDSREGWARALYRLMEGLYNGKQYLYDLARLRPRGARLKTFGGRSSGPEPLKQLFEFVIKTFKGAQGRKLNSLECYDIVTMIASVVIAGGVRRSATINLSNFSDRRMAKAKDGQFWIDNPQRTLSNNSVAYTEKPDISSFMEEWLNLMKSGTGERGIVNREGLKKQAAKHGRRNPNHEFGVNPCGEVILRPRQFCNLTEVVVRPEDTIETLEVKVKHATILGILQSTLTKFNYLSDTWKKNVEEERLLGVSLTGLQDHLIYSKTTLHTALLLEILKDKALQTAEEWAEALGINTPTAITSVKPSGTVSQLVDSSSGLHSRYAPYYIRRVRVSISDPLTKFLMAEGVPCNPEVGETWEDCTTVVFDFPIKSPNMDVNFRDDRTAIEQLEYWKLVKLHWCEHNPSVTIYVKPEEWLEVGAWVYKHWDIATGITFLPYDGGVYQLAPYEEIDEDTYTDMIEAMPDLDFSKLTKYEKEDKTEGSREYACQGGACEL